MLGFYLHISRTPAPLKQTHIPPGGIPTLPVPIVVPLHPLFLRPVLVVSALTPHHPFFARHSSRILSIHLCQCFASASQCSHPLSFGCRARPFVTSVDSFLGSPNPIIRRSYSATRSAAPPRKRASQAACRVFLSASESRPLLFNVSTAPDVSPFRWTSSWTS
jgi:hypothetical protein